MLKAKHRLYAFFKNISQVLGCNENMAGWFITVVKRQSQISLQGMAGNNTEEGGPLTPERRYSLTPLGGGVGRWLKANETRFNI